MISDYELNINILILKYVNGTITEDEAVLLADWAKASESNTLYFQAMCSSFERQVASTADADLFWENLRKSIVPRDKATAARHANGKAWRRVAGVVLSLAAVVVVAIVSIFRHESKLQLPAMAQSGEQVVIAAAEGDNSLSAGEVEFSTSANEHKRIVLPDGSIVILNSNSRLTQCEGFNEKERNVVLCGEAYFDVAKSAKQFTVHTASKSFIVHGTSFNIFDYDDNRCAIVTLHTGKLEARVKDNAFMLKPGEELRVDEVSRSISKHTVDIGNSISWLDKQLKFSRLPLKFVANQLSHKYGVKVNIHPSIEDINFTGQLQEEDIATALRLITITSPIKVTVNEYGGEYYISKLE